MKTILYDFKRCFVRPSIIISLILFTLAGVGVPYLIIHNSPGIVDAYLIGVYRFGDGRLNVYGYLLNGDGSGLPDSKIELIYGANLLNTTYTDSSGFFNINGDVGASWINNTFILNASIPTGWVETEIEVPYFFIGQFGKVDGVTFIHAPRLYSHGYIYTPLFSAAILNIDLDSGLSKVVIASSYINAKLSYTTLNIKKDIGRISQIKARYLFNSSLYNNLTYLDAGMLKWGVNFIDIKVDPKDGLLIFKIEDLDSGVVEYYPIEYVSEPRIKAIITASATSSIDFFNQFFPIIFLYLIYTYIVKPRISGALEFILARPITRLELYINRYISGVLTALASSAILVIVSSISIKSILSVEVALTNILYLFVGASLSLIAFYTVLYLVSMYLGSGGYLGVSIGLYLLFYMFWPLIPIIFVGFNVSNYLNYMYLSYYFNPSGIYHLMSYYINKGYNLTSSIEVVRPLYICISTSLWIALPLALGYLRFRRINLS